MSANIFHARPQPAADPALLYRRVRAGAIAFYAVLVAAILATGALLSWNEHQERLQENEAETRSLARALEQHVSRIVDAGTQTLADARVVIEAEGGPRQGISPLLRRMHQHQELHGGALRSVWVVDSMGFRVEPPSPAGQPPLDLSNRASFQHHRNNPSRTAHLAPPVASQADGRWVIPLTLRLDDADQRFDGIVTTAIDADKLGEFYRSLEAKPTTSIVLLTPDLFLYMREPRDDRLIGVPATMEGVTRLEGLEGPVAFYGRTTLEPRVGSYRKLSSANLYVMVTTDRRAVLRPMVAHTAMRATLCLGLVALASLLLVIFVRQMQRESRSAERLAEANLALERRVRERTAELEAANSELESFGYSISHDLQAPLRHLSGYAGLLKQEHGANLDADALRLLDRINERSVHMADLVQALLQLSKVARAPVARAPVDLSAMVAGIAEELRQQNPGFGIGIEVAPGIVADADATLVRTLLQNLVANAFKFSRLSESPRLVFERDARDRRAPFVVRDNGTGFDPSQAARLFEPFQRLHGEREYEGHGIGLAICRRIVQRHGGRIWAEGEPGRGASFYFTLG